MSEWKRTLWVTALSQVLCIMGFSFVVPFLPLYIQNLGVHGITRVTFWAAVLSGGSAVCMAITAPIWGVLADRHGRKIMVTRAAFSAAILIGLMGLSQNIWQLLVLRMLQGMFTGTVSASQALVASQSPRERLGFSLGIMQTAVFVGNSMGPVFGGVIADVVGFRQSFAVAGACLFIAGIIVVLFVHEDKRFEDQKNASRPSFMTSMREAIQAPALLSMIGALFAVQFALTVVFPVLPQFIQYLQGPAGHAATATGLVLAGAGIAGAISSVFAGYVSDRVGYKMVLVAAAAISALVSIPQYWVTATWQLLVLRVLLGFSTGAVMPSASALLASLVSSEKRGAAYGLSGSATAIGFAAGPLTAAMVVSVANVRAVFLTAAILLGCIALWVSAAVHVPPDQGDESTSSVEGHADQLKAVHADDHRTPEIVSQQRT